MLPDLDSLRCFLAAADTLNFRAAAEQVHLSPAAFGERIARLESLLDVRLFERTTRRVRLTASGERLRPAAVGALDAARACLAAVDETAAPTPFSLTIGTRFELGMSWLVPSLKLLAEARPERSIHLYFGDSADLLDRLRRRRLDAVVSSVRLSDRKWSFAALHEEHYVLVAKPSLQRRAPIRRAADAEQHVLLDAHPDLPLFSYFLDARPATETWRFARVELLGAIGAIRLRALDGAGFAVLPTYFVQDDLREKRLVRVLPKAKLKSDLFRLVWRQDHEHPGRLNALAETLRGVPLQ